MNTSRAVALSLLAFAACRDRGMPATGPTAAVATASTPTPGAAPLVLRGTIMTPAGVVKHGYVAIENGRIIAVSDKQPDLPDAVLVNTHGIILPGFVDVHNHVPWNALPRWTPGRTFTNRNQWRTDPEFQRAVGVPFDHVAATQICDLNTWGELRALVGGTTSVLATHRVACIRGLVRNLDYNSGFYGTTQLNLEHIFNVIDLPPASDPVARAQFVGAARFFIANPFYEALAIHLAEGTDAAAEEEFSFMQGQALLNPKGVLIHGIPLSASDVRAMAAAGTALVWSPRSNLELYGATADVRAAVAAGVEVALAPDWAITGSSNMLDELKVADQWNRERLGGFLSDSQLVDMATATAARIVGVEDEVGAIRVGLRADLVVMDGDDATPYRAVVEATPAAVQLVLINGVPLYGGRQLMEQLWSRDDLEELVAPLEGKLVATAAAGVAVAAVAGRLQAALAAEGTSLAPVAETHR